MCSVAKGNYIRGKGGIKHALSHVRYLELRAGDDREHAEGRRRKFINAHRDGISGAEVRERIRQLDEGKIVIHRIVLSPGVDGVDMNEYTRFVMAELQHAKGREFEYFSTDHKNTDHDHAHVIIIGSDQSGKEIRLNRFQYRAIREAGDRYLERHHEYTRYLDKDLDRLMERGYVRDKGDELFEDLISDLRKEHGIEECDEQRDDQFIRLLKIKAPPKEEIIVDGNVVYSRHSSLGDLQVFAEKLKAGVSSRISKKQHASLLAWISKKEKHGDDYFQRTAEADRLQRLFDEGFKNISRNDNSPPKSFRQYVFETRGRLLTFHEKYTISMERDRLQKEIALFAKNESDSSKRAQLVDHLEWLNELARESDLIKSRSSAAKISLEKQIDVPAKLAEIEEGRVSETEIDVSCITQKLTDHIQNIFAGETKFFRSKEETAFESLIENRMEAINESGDIARMHEELSYNSVEELLFDGAVGPDIFKSTEKMRVEAPAEHHRHLIEKATRTEPADVHEEQTVPIERDETPSLQPDQNYPDLDKSVGEVKRLRLDDDVGRARER